LKGNEPLIERAKNQIYANIIDLKEEQNKMMIDYSIQRSMSKVKNMDEYIEVNMNHQVINQVKGLFTLLNTIVIP